jgi:hypothetical protein
MEAASESENPVDDGQALDQMYFEHAEGKIDE